MSTSREIILQKISENNRLSCHAYLAKDKSVWNRLFNGFPNLLDQDKLVDLRHQFQQFLTQIKKIEVTDDKTELMNNADKSQVNKWGSQIAEEACQFLLDKQTIHSDIIKALQLENKIDPKNPEVIQAMMCSLVGNVILEQIIPPLENDIKAHQNTYHALCRHINAHYGQWIQKELKKRGFEIAKPTSLSPFIFRFLSQPKNALTVVAMLTGIVAIGMAFFKTKESKGEPPSNQNLHSSTLT